MSTNPENSHPSQAEMEYARCWGLLGKPPPQPGQSVTEAGVDDLSDILYKMLAEQKASQAGLHAAREMLEVCRDRIQEVLEQGRNGASLWLRQGDLHKIEDALERVNKSLTG